jgi:proline iminopeptidase
MEKVVEVDRLKDGTPVRISVRTYGNPKGVPLMYLHGGPGDCSTSDMATVYDQSKYFVLLFDQRGAGRSTPKNCLEKNTTQHLVADIEKIRVAFFGTPMVLAGGSWGTALALVYSIKYPKNVVGLLLRSFYDLTPGRTEYAFFPELRAAIERIAKTPRDITRKLMGKRDAKRRTLVRLLASSAPLYVTDAPPKKDPFSVAETIAIIGQHYEINRFFLPKNFIYKFIDKIQHIHVIIIQGRFDVVTPPLMAFRFSELHGNCDLRLVAGGHSLYEKNVRSALRNGAKDLYGILVSGAASSIG